MMYVLTKRFICHYSAFQLHEIKIHSNLVNEIVLHFNFHTLQPKVIEAISWYEQESHCREYELNK